MTQQQTDHAVEELTADLARLRIGFVNVYFAGTPGGDAPWALVDTGLAMGAAAILSVAADRFGVNARPAALTRVHAEIDAAVCVAYGLAAEASEATVLARLVALNHERAAEERAGTVRWLRPGWQGGRGS